MKYHASLWNNMESSTFYIGHCRDVSFFISLFHDGNRRYYVETGLIN